MMFSAILIDAFKDCDAGSPIKNRFDSVLFNLRRLPAKFKVQTDVLDKLIFADDLVENAKHTEKKYMEQCIHVISMRQPLAQKD